MENRIKIVWILSLISIFLLIGVQGYWLYNQYQYVTDQYLQELSEQILQAGDEEFRLRKADVKSTHTYIINRNTEYNENDSNQTRSDKVVFSITRKESSQEDSITKVLSLRWNNNMPDNELHTGIDRAATNINNAFRQEALDSILSAELPDIRFSFIPWGEKDTSRFDSYWEKAGSFLHPKILVSYAYSPLQQEGVFIYADIPSQPLLARMGIQLILALGLILLLIGCLVFQIKTIMKQKKLSELRESFVNTMIHELKRPVQTLKTFVAFLGDKDMRSDEESTEQVVQDSMFELDSLSAYLTKLKDMMRADSENTSLRPIRFNLQELTEKVIRLTHIPQGKKVNISAAYEMASPWIEADPVHIANILSNLIENAVKYSGEQVEIQINARQKDRKLWLTVTDSGIGIPFAEQEKVFAKFYRGSNIPDRNIPGIGLGLSYVKLITEAHNGQVSLTSNHGEGTSITLYLPQ